MCQVQYLTEFLFISNSVRNGLLHDNCPLDYCKPTSFWLQLEHPDEQCAYKHSGLLCGRCKSNLSLAIGTSQCLECTNTHLTLLLPFALAGLILVLFLIVCNLTVSMGTINGLVFYANIVRVNHAFFLQGKHTALFLMALIVTVLFILPFTLLLLFAPCIQASNHFLFKRLKMKLWPLLDAYQAPYKDKFRFWTALMLVVRSILLVGYGLNILGDPDINHLLTVTVLSVLLCCIWVTGIVYKTTALNILEASFILNLLILSGWTIYNRRASNRDSSNGQTALVCTSTGVAFSTFICIIFYHTYLYLKSAKLHLCFKRNKIKRGDRRMSGAVGESVGSAVDAPPHHPPTRTVIELREPLLTDN